MHPKPNNAPNIKFRAKYHLNGARVLFARRVSDWQRQYRFAIGRRDVDAVKCCCQESQINYPRSKRRWLTCIVHNVVNPVVDLLLLHLRPLQGSVISKWKQKIGCNSATCGEFLSAASPQPKNLSTDLMRKSGCSDKICNIGYPAKNLSASRFSSAISRGVFSGAASGSGLWWGAVKALEASLRSRRRRRKTLTAGGET
jgi:hypothetical protein